MPRNYYYIVSLYWCSFLLLGFTFSILSVSINFTLMFTISLDMFLWCLMKNCSKTHMFECFVIRERHKLRKIRNVTLEEGWPFGGIISPTMWFEVSVAQWFYLLAICGSKCWTLSCFSCTVSGCMPSCSLWWR